MTPDRDLTGADESARKPQPGPSGPVPNDGRKLPTSPLDILVWGILGLVLAATVAAAAVAPALRVSPDWAISRIGVPSLLAGAIVSTPGIALVSLASRARGRGLSIAWLAVTGFVAVVVFLWLFGGYYECFRNNNCL